MRTLNLQLFTDEGDELERIRMDDFPIAEAEWEAPPEQTHEEIAEHARALFAASVTLLRERGGAPLRGLMWLQLALGEAILTAAEQEGDVVVDIVVRPLTEGEDDAPCDPDDN